MTVFISSQSYYRSVEEMVTNPGQKSSLWTLFSPETKVSENVLILTII